MKRYEIKRTGADPFDIMCDDCPVDPIEWWEAATMEILHEQHEDELACDASTPEWFIEAMKKDGIWHPSNPDFDLWMKEAIASGYVREVV